jgi:hypothetical protein
VFFEGTVAAGIPLNDEKSGMLYGNHIYIVMWKDLLMKQTLIFLSAGIKYGSPGTKHVRYYQENHIILCSMKCKKGDRNGSSS